MTREWLMAACGGLLVGGGARFIADRWGGERTALIEGAGGGTAMEKARVPGAATDGRVQRPSIEEIRVATGSGQLRRLAIILEQADVALVEEAARLYTGEKTDQNDLALRLVFARWAELDPAAAVEFAKSCEPMAHDRTRVIAAAIQSWARLDYDAALGAAMPHGETARVAALLGLTSHDPERAMAELESRFALFDGALRYEVWDKIFARLARVDPSRAALLAQQTGRQAISTAAIVRVWAEKDPEAAFEWMRSNPSAIDNSEAIAGLMRSTERHHPGAGEKLLAACTPGALRFRLARELARVRAQRDPASAWEYVQEQPAGIERNAMAAAVGRAAIDAGDWEFARIVAEDLKWERKLFSPSDYRINVGGSGFGTSGGDTWNDDFIPALLRRLSTTDPQRAIEALKRSQRPERYVGPSGGDDLLLTAYSTWLKQDEKSAISSALQGDDADAVWLARAMARHDRNAALSQFDALPAGAKRDEFLRGLAREFQNPADGLQWSRSLSGEERTLAIITTLQAWSESDPLTMARQADQVPELREFPHALRTLIWHVQNVEAAAAVPLLDLLADGSKRDYTTLAHRYAQQDPRGASEWIASLAQGEQRDAAINSLVNYLERTEGDYEAAFAWAGSATDDAQQHKDLERIAERWLRRDEAAARAAIDASSLPDETKARLLKK